MWASSCGASRGRVGGARAVFAAVLGTTEQDIPARLAPTDRAGDQCGRDLDHRTRHSLGHRFWPWPESAATARAAACSDCPSSPSRGPAPISARAAAAVWVQGCACGCTARRTSRRAPLHRAGDTAHESRRAAAAPGRGRLGRGGELPLHRCPRFAGAQRRLSTAARAAGAGRRSAHHAPRAGHGAAAARSAPGVRPAREQALSRAKASCSPSCRA